MSRYLKSFGISFLLHATALIVGVYVAIGGAAEGKDLLLVDFSTIAFTEGEESGSLPAAPFPVPPTPAPEIPTPPPPKPEPVAAPKAVPAPPKPEPIAAPKAVPVKETPREKAAVPRPQPVAPQTPQPVQTAQAPASRIQTADSGTVQGGSGGSGHRADSAAGTGGAVEANGSGPGSGTDHDQALTRGYVKANFNYILARIQRNLDYPSQARRLHLTGISRVSFIIKMDGHIDELTLTESSGHALLDAAAFKAVQDAAPFPAPPVAARIILPIKFSLHG